MRHRSVRLVIALVVSVELVAGCGTGLMLPISRSRGIDVSTGDADLRFLPWAVTEPTLVVVDKEKHRLSVFERGRRVGSYPAVFGREDGRKLFEGDRRTPSGFYRITRKRTHRRFHRFFDLDYPNADDRRVFLDAVASGLLKQTRMSPPRMGGSIGIHGTDDEKLNRLGVDWTLGCVSLTNHHMDELEELVAEGTPVLIRDGESPFAVRLLPPETEGERAPRHARTEQDDRLETSERSSPSAPRGPRHAMAERSDPPRPR